MKIIYKSLLWLSVALLPALASASQDTAIDEIFGPYNNTDTPGCAVGVYQNGQMAFQKGYGMASLELEVPNSPRSVYYIASTSKQFAAAAIALASLEGKLSLDDPISQYFPELPGYAQAIQVKHLVHHSSGLRDYLELMAMGGWPFENIYTNQWVLDLIARQQDSNFVPGDKYSYSNSGYFLIGELIERVNGETLRQYTDEKIFKPLGMIHTHFHDNRLEIDKDRAAGYAPVKDGGYQLEWFTNFDKVGSGGLFTTVEDLLLWERNFIDDQLGGGELVKMMLQPGILNNGEQQNYAFGLTHGEHRGLKTVGHGGAFMGFRAQFIRFPERELAISVLCNLTAASPGRLATQVADLYISDLPEPGESAEKPPEDLKIAARLRKKYRGDYQQNDVGALAAIFDKDNGLMVSMLGGEFPLVAQSDTLFTVTGLPFDVDAAFSLDGSSFTVSISGRVYGEYQKTGTVDPAAETLEAYQGRFYSAELDSEYRISADNGQLTVQSGSLEPLILAATFTDTFAHPVHGFVLVFQRDGQGAVTGIRLNSSRVIGVGFVKIEEGGLAAAGSLTDDPIVGQFENSLALPIQLEGEKVQKFNILERMKEHGVPGVSMALINHGKIAWVRTWGVKDLGSNEPVYPDTLFQAASISKPVAAFAAMRLVDRGDLSLSAPINKALKRWQVPANDFTQEKPVTLQGLVSHTAGMTVHGFDGYDLDAPYPTILQVLNGEEPANSSAIVVDTLPGSIWRYSGGGFTVMQVAMEDASGTTFVKLMDDLVLQPSGMSLSTYQQPLPRERWQEAATAYRLNLQTVEHQFHAYPELAAAGLWTTPGDLARFALAVSRTWHGEKGALLSPELAKEYLSLQKGSWGLGFKLYQDDGETIGFSHGGANEGFRASLVGFLDGSGAVIMTNSDTGSALINEMLVAAASIYDWPERKSTIRKKLALHVNDNLKFSGDYEMVNTDSPEDLAISVRAEADGIVVSVAGYMPATMFYLEKKEGGTAFFFSQIGAELHFTTNDDGMPVLNMFGNQAIKINEG